MKKSLLILIPILAIAALLMFFPEPAIRVGQFINDRIPALERLWNADDPERNLQPLGSTDEFMSGLAEAFDLAYPEPEPEVPLTGAGRPMPEAGIMTKYYSSAVAGGTGNGYRGQPTTVEELLALPVPDFAPDPDRLIFKSEEWHKRYGRGYYLVVNYRANTVTVYASEYGKGYNVPVKAFVCSAGRDTPRYGFFKLGIKHRWVVLFGEVYGQYSTEICGDILFHSVPYKRYERPDSLEYDEFDKLGTTASAGCIRLQVADAKWIFSNAHRIVGVQFVDEEDPGPLGKPEAMKISNYFDFRGWDPTDPNKYNPWHRYLASLRKNKKIQKTVDKQLWACYYDKAD